ncbi:Beauvericin cluster-specific repressor BEA4 [Lachnellula suecica]|uniref:Beauvericin cluster-specific repressor BEA4 n=1 Tax=Lachnellula suecica TaxID=602035 RepID=A0A8T9C633_9HELO|nr:Beauvericin cluster-specific repressor BEA4 [Lachnellula suecica]
MELHLGSNTSAANQSTSQTRASNSRKGPKSRNGCLRCKNKRLKCDEGKPECLQCNRKNLPCPGYKAKSLVWSTKHEKLLVPSSHASSLPSAETVQSISQVESSPTTRAMKELKECQMALYPKANSELPADTAPASPQPSIDSRPDSNQFTDSLAAIRQQLHRSTVPEFLLHLPTMLVEYYFNYVCQIFSSFDGTLNPFRSTVGKLWDGSAPIYFAIQSMAAAYLANHFPRMTPVGIQMQRETYRSLYQVQQAGKGQPENLDKMLLTVLLVGQTTAWHNPKDLGLTHLKTAKRLNRQRLEQQGLGVGVRDRRQNEFFQQCIMYWDMLASFVEHDVEEFGFIDAMPFEATLATSSNDAGASCSSQESERVFPHPWTGISPKVQSLFAQVGRLIRSYRKITALNAQSLDFLSLDFTFNTGTFDSHTAIQQAQDLEEELLSFQPPPASNLVDAGDENTPVHQYILLAEAYRCAALLELYRVFPSVLLRRVPLADTPFESSPLESNVFDFLDINTSQPPEDFILSLALHTISLLEKLPLSSGTRCLQPILFIVAGSELHFHQPFDPLSTSTFTPTTPLISNSITNREVDIATARRFVTSRLQDFCNCLPAKPVKQALVLVEETWARGDAGMECFWMDVMQEMGLETIFG